MIRRNTIANLIGRAWGLVSLFVFIPFYIDYLGSQSYGYIGLYISFVTLLAFADLGFSASTTREFARLALDEHAQQKANLLRTYEIIYIIICIVILLFFFGTNKYIANEWITNNVNDTESSTIILLMGIAVSILLPSNLYIGALMGQQRQVVANFIQVVWGISRGLLSLFCFEFIEPTLEVFFFCQILSNVLYLIALKYFVWRKLNVTKRNPEWKLLKTTSNYAFGMACLGLLSSVLLQMDKFFVSKNFSIETFGYYSISATLASVPFILCSTFGKAVFPKFTQLQEGIQSTSISQLYFKYASFLVVTVITLSSYMAYNINDLLFIWTKSDEIVATVSTVTCFLLIFQSFQSLTILPFFLASSRGNVSINIKYSIIMILIMFLGIYTLYPIYAINGVAGAVAIASLIVFVPYMYEIHVTYSRRLFFYWIFIIVTAMIFNAIFYVVVNNYSVLEGTTTLERLIVNFIIFYLPSFAMMLCIVRFLVMKLSVKLI